MGISEILTDYTLRTVALGTAVLGILSGALGTFAVLRRQSLLGDAISHAALPGIAIAFMLTGSKSSLILIIGAALAGWLGTLLILSIVKNTRIKEDAALGLVLSVFFGFGLVLLTFIQRRPDASQAGLDKFLFGQAATLLQRDVVSMAVLAFLAMIVLILFWKEFKLLSFDPGFGKSMGFPIQYLEILLTSLIVIAIVLGLQTVGVVLMSAMIVAPAAAARQWTDKLSIMVVLSGMFGAFAGVGGALLSSSFQKVPTGPAIVLVISLIVLISLIFATNRGLFWAYFREQKNRKQIQLDAVLSDLYILAVQHDSIDHGHTIEVLRSMAAGHGGVDGSLAELKRNSLAKQMENGKWTLTSQGFDKAREEAERRGDSE